MSLVHYQLDMTFAVIDCGFLGSPRALREFNYNPPQLYSFCILKLLFHRKRFECSDAYFTFNKKLLFSFLTCSLFQTLNICSEKIIRETKWYEMTQGNQKSGFRDVGDKFQVLVTKYILLTLLRCKCTTRILVTKRAKSVVNIPQLVSHFKSDIKMYMCILSPTPVINIDVVKHEDSEKG